MRNISAVVVWYNPSIKCIENIGTYIEYVDKIYIVDNSDENNVNLVPESNKILYLPQGKNVGIATALNIGFTKAKDDGYEWCLSMDQDSSWEERELEGYLTVFNENSKNYYSFSPYANSPIIHSILGELKRKIKKSSYPIDKFANNNDDRWITSGNILNLRIWDEIGKFKDELFIDEVDFNFCARFSEKGYKNYPVNEYSISHNLGTPKKTIFPKTDFHNSFRLYFMFRNMLYMMEKYPAYTEKYKYKVNFKHLVKEKCIYEVSIIKKIQNLRILKKAKQDFLELCKE